MGLPSNPTERQQKLVSGAIPYPIPAHYNLVVFFGLTNFIMFAVMCGIAGFGLESVHPLEWLTFPATFLLANLLEYVLHRGPMHHVMPLARVLFNVHTRSHHAYFTHDTMPIEDSKEAYKVLFFFRDNFTLLGLFVLLYVGLAFVATPNIAGFAVITAAAYYLLYEWLHLAYHAPAPVGIDRIPLLGALKRHHQAHHNPAYMNRYNFNLTLPIWDVLLGTRYREGERGSRGAGV